MEDKCTDISLHLSELISCFNWGCNRSFFISNRNMCALIISVNLSWIRVSLRKERRSDRNILSIGIFSVPLNRCRFSFFMCNYKLKISIMWSTIYAVTALSKWAVPCLIQVENFCLWGFLIHSASCLLVKFSLSLLLGKWSGNSFLNYDSQVPKVLVARTPWLSTMYREVKTSHKMHIWRPWNGHPHWWAMQPHVLEGLSLSGRALPGKHSLESLCLSCLQIIFKLSYSS